ncbi:hypothetical protein DDB_G0288581 [Dictyostelium discoideum AX4]|uniref:Uncharacterized protein n=1 Tax=Dictyostelium discoideum TaxID=44689 RepID=Q54IQ9_DICDI|nr:hypothetical protein DDB_G0288581 [Dictyostelium discoideum AX4]EAL63150.1 hypothetical protein DDB_G0288581 [Dictyostelium discoideum AX4]|eukprot:XP_636655.1 hypothetical protein DDB_G0288581 [Dictyostelium discoideum AX4]
MARPKSNLTEEEKRARKREIDRASKRRTKYKNDETTQEYRRVNRERWREKQQKEKDQMELEKHNLFENKLNEKQQEIQKEMEKQYDVQKILLIKEYQEKLEKEKKKIVFEHSQNHIKFNGVYCSSFKTSLLSSEPNLNMHFIHNDKDRTIEPISEKFFKNKGGAMFSENDAVWSNFGKHNIISFFVYTNSGDEIVEWHVSLVVIIKIRRSYYCFIYDPAGSEENYFENEEVKELYSWLLKNNIKILFSKDHTKQKTKNSCALYVHSFIKSFISYLKINENIKSSDVLNLMNHVSKKNPIGELDIEYLNTFNDPSIATYNHSEQ